MAAFVLNFKLVLYLQSQYLTESLGFLNPPLLQAAKCFSSFKNKSSFNGFIYTNYKFKTVKINP
jgi:hypothetical protein